MEGNTEVQGRTPTDKEILAKLDKLLQEETHIFDPVEVEDIKRAVKFSKMFDGHREELMKVAIAVRKAEGFVGTAFFLAKWIPIIVAIWVVWNTNAERAMEWIRGWGLGR